MLIQIDAQPSTNQHAAGMTIAEAFNVKTHRCAVYPVWTLRRDLAVAIDGLHEVFATPQLSSDWLQQ